MGMGENSGENTGMNTGSAGRIIQQPGSPDFGRVFFTDFRDGTYTLVEGTGNLTFDGQFEPLIRSTARDGQAGPLTAGFMAESQIQQPNPGSADSWIEANNWPYTSEMLLRMWIRLDEDFVVSTNWKFGRHGYKGPADDDSATLGTVNSEYMDIIMYGVGGSTPTVAFVSPHPWRTGPGAYQWHKLEIYFKESFGGDGIYRTWVDDVIIGDYAGANIDSTTPGNSWNHIVVPSNLVSGNDSGGVPMHLYVDAIEVFSDQGTGGTGSMENGTAEQA